MGFKVGQEVIFSKGDLKDVRGVVTTPFWQVSQSDYPEVILDYRDDQGNLHGLFVDIDDVRPAEDPYEYALWFHYSYLDEPTLPQEHMWNTKEAAEACLRSFQGMVRKSESTSTPITHKVKIVKRRKAGPIEDV